MGLYQHFRRKLRKVGVPLRTFSIPLKKVAFANPVEVPLVYAMAPDSEEDIDEEDNEGGEDD